MTVVVSNLFVPAKVFVPLRVMVCVEIRTYPVPLMLLVKISLPPGVRLSSLEFVVMIVPVPMVVTTVWPIVIGALKTSLIPVRIPPRIVIDP